MEQSGVALGGVEFPVVEEVVLVALITFNALQPTLVQQQGRVW